MPAGLLRRLTSNLRKSSRVAPSPHSSSEDMTLQPPTSPRSPHSPSPRRQPRTSAQAERETKLRRHASKRQNDAEDIQRLVKQGGFQEDWRDIHYDESMMESLGLDRGDDSDLKLYHQYMKRYSDAKNEDELKVVNIIRPYYNIRYEQKTPLSRAHYEELDHKLARHFNPRVAPVSSHITPYRNVRDNPMAVPEEVPEMIQEYLQGVHPKWGASHHSGVPVVPDIPQHVISAHHKHREYERARLRFEEIRFR